jgi:hypothetical protein
MKPPALSPPPAPVRPALEFGLPEDGLRMDVRPPRRAARLGAVRAAAAAAAASALVWAYVPDAPPGLPGALALGAAVGLFWYLYSRASARIAFDRTGIHDFAAGLPPLPWVDIERLEVVPAPGGRAGDGALFARLTPAANAGRLTRWGGLAGRLMPAAARLGVLLPGTAEPGLPVPFEYLILQLRRRGAPVRAPDPAFDPFDCDARWLPPRQSAGMLADRLGARARPYAGQNLDIAETRGDRGAAAHWRAVLGDLRQRAGLVAAED